MCFRPQVKIWSDTHLDESASLGLVAYLTMLSVSRLYTIELFDVWYSSKRKRFGRKWLWPNRDIIPLSALRVVKTVQETSVRTVCVPTDNRTNTSWTKFRALLLLFQPNRYFVSSSSKSIQRLVTGWTTEGSEFRVPVGSRIFSSPCRPHRLWGPPNLSNGYRGLFPRR
jgi:hypothetical protein